MSLALPQEQHNNFGQSLISCFPSTNRNEVPSDWVNLKTKNKKVTPSESQLGGSGGTSVVKQSNGGNATTFTGLPPTGESLLLTGDTEILFRIPVLGSSRSGKTTLIHQFLDCNHFKFQTVKNNNTEPTYYDPVITFSERIYRLRLVDCPAIQGDFPSNSYDEWARYRGWGLRSACAFILIFDVTSGYSFKHIRHLRDQIVAEFSDIPLILVANKMDVFQSPEASNLNATLGVNCHTGGATSGRDARALIRREVAVLIKKQWRGTVMVECSAKFNWHVLTVFKELMRALESRVQNHRPIAAARAVQSVLRRHDQCVFM